MPKAPIGKLVRYYHDDQEFAAIITRGIDSPDAIAFLTVFGLQGESYRKAPFSEKPKHGHWTWVPVKSKE